jgi:hypothetical protein
VKKSSGHALPSESSASGSLRGGGRERGRVTRTPFCPSGTSEVVNLGELPDEVALEDGWGIREASFKPLPGEPFGLVADDFPSHR